MTAQLLYLLWVVPRAGSAPAREHLAAVDAEAVGLRSESQLRESTPERQRVSPAVSRAFIFSGGQRVQDGALMSGGAGSVGDATDVYLSRAPSRE